MAKGVTRTRRPTPVMPDHDFSPVVTEWSKKTITVSVTPTEEGEEPVVVGTLFRTPETGWQCDSLLAEFIGQIPEVEGPLDAKERAVHNYENRHLVAQRRAKAIEEHVAAGVSEEVAESTIDRVLSL